MTDELGGAPEEEAGEGEEESDGWPEIEPVVERLEASSELQYQLETGSADELPLLVIGYPSERATFDVEYDYESAPLLAKFDFEKARFLSQTGGLYFTGENSVEVMVRIRRAALLSQIPGVKIDKEVRRRVSRTPQYILRVSNRRGAKIELSRPTERFSAINGMLGTRTGYSLKFALPKRQFPTGSREIETAMRELCLAFFFELDVRYGLSVDFYGIPTYSLGASSWRELDSQKASFPKQSYPSQALSLYQYARSALGFPLLAFLGYYQVLEFFFPVFSQRVAVQKVRKVIQSPRFSSHSDQSVLDVVLSARAAGGGYTSERQQLSATVEYCVEAEDVLAYIRSSEEVEKYFSDKRQPLPGVAPLRLGDADGLLKQVIDRVYDIRCRIVHTKSDGGDGAVELLLPDSSEVRQLAPDVELVRLLAQAALVSGAEPIGF